MGSDRTEKQLREDLLCQMEEDNFNLKPLEGRKYLVTGRELKNLQEVWGPGTKFLGYELVTEPFEEKEQPSMVVRKTEDGEITVSEE